MFLSFVYSLCQQRPKKATINANLLNEDIDSFFLLSSIRVKKYLGFTLNYNLPGLQQHMVQKVPLSLWCLLVPPKSCSMLMVEKFYEPQSNNNRTLRFELRTLL